LSKQNPTYYAIITADVRYDNDLPPNAKLLYGEITALANATGICTASNAYFAKLYDVKVRAVSEWVSMLAGKGYIEVNVIVNFGNKREIVLPIVNNHHTYSEKTLEGSSENSLHNNTSINNKARTSSTEPSADILKAYNLYLKYFISGITRDIAGPVFSKPLMEAAMKRYRLTPKRKAALERRLKDAEPKMVFAAIVGFGRADWSNGNNDRRWKADLADFICRSYENVERGARLYEEQRAGSRSDDPWNA